MDKSDFKQTLLQLEPGQCLVVPYKIFEDRSRQALSMMHPRMPHIGSQWPTAVSSITNRTNGKYRS